MRAKPHEYEAHGGAASFSLEKSTKIRDFFTL